MEVGWCEWPRPLLFIAVRFSQHGQQRGGMIPLCGRLSLGHLDEFPQRKGVRVDAEAAS
jgi:hypothetical protein